jgi:hypothetical protein
VEIIHAGPDYSNKTKQLLSTKNHIWNLRSCSESVYYTSDGIDMNFSIFEEKEIIFQKQMIVTTRTTQK